MALFSSFSYFLMNFDSPPEVPLELMDNLYRDGDIIRRRILRKEEEVGRPCDKGPCDYGELDDDKRKRLRINMKEFVKQL